MNTRNLRFFEFLGCAGLIVFALHLQHNEGLTPCPMCILQRYAFILIGLFALLSALTHQQRLTSTAMSILIFITSAFGFGVAGRHVWLEHNPPKIFDCGADLGFMVDTFPLAEALPMIFRGTGDCSIVLWRFLGLSIAEWAFVCFGILLLVEIYISIKSVKMIMSKKASLAGF